MKKHIFTSFELFKVNEERDEEYFDYKETESKGELTKVTAIELDQAVSRSSLHVETLNALDEYGRLYEKCDRMIKELTNRRKQAKDDFIETADTLFEVADGTVTRVVETQNLLVTISKHDPDRVDQVSDYKAALNYINENYPDLNDVINEALDNTMSSKKAPAAKLSNVSIKRRRGGIREYDPGEDEIEESRKITEGVGSWLSSLWNKVKRVFSRVDKNLDAAKSLVYGE